MCLNSVRDQVKEVPSSRAKAQGSLSLFCSNIAFKCYAAHPLHAVPPAGYGKLGHLQLFEKSALSSFFILLDFVKNRSKNCARSRRTGLEEMWHQYSLLPLQPKS
jgi:hypothetical protein